MDRDLKAELTCPVCMELFSQPLRLGCGHSYCRRCLVSLERQPDLSVWNLIGYISFITCPECRRVFDLPPIGVDALPPDFKLTKLVDVYKKMSATLRQITGEPMSDSDSVRESASNTRREIEVVYLCSRCGGTVAEAVTICPRCGGTVADAPSEAVVATDPNADDVSTRNADDISTRNEDDVITRNADGVIIRNVDDVVTRNADDVITRNADDFVTCNLEDISTRNTDRVREHDTDDARIHNVNNIAYAASSRTVDVDDARIRNLDDVTRTDSSDVITRVSSDILVVFSRSVDDSFLNPNTHVNTDVRTLARERFVSSLTPSSSVDDVWRTTSEYNLYRLIERRNSQVDVSCTFSERSISSLRRTAGAVCHDARLLTGDRANLDSNRGNLGDRAEINMDAPAEGNSGATEGCGRINDLLVAGSNLLEDIKELIAMGDEILTEADEILDGVLEIRRTAVGGGVVHGSEFEPARIRRWLQFAGDITSTPGVVRVTSRDVRSTLGDASLTDADVRATFGDVRASTSGGVANNVNIEPVGFNRRIFRRSWDPLRTRTSEDRVNGDYITVRSADWDRPGRDAAGCVGTTFQTTAQEAAELSEDRDRHRRCAVSTNVTADGVSSSSYVDVVGREETERFCGERTRGDEEVIVTTLNAISVSSSGSFNPGMASPMNSRGNSSPGIQSTLADGPQDPDAISTIANSEGKQPDGSVTTVLSNFVRLLDSDTDNKQPAIGDLNYSNTEIVHHSARDSQMELVTRNVTDECSITEEMRRNIYCKSSDREASLQTKHIDRARIEVDRARVEVDRTTPGMDGTTAGQYCSDEDNVQRNQVDKITVGNRKAGNLDGSVENSIEYIDQGDMACDVSLESVPSDESERPVQDVIKSAHGAEITSVITGVGGDAQTYDVGTRISRTSLLSDGVSRPRYFDIVRGDTSISGMDCLTGVEVIKTNDEVSTTTDGEQGSSRKHDGELDGQDGITAETAAKSVSPEIETAKVERIAVERRKDHSCRTGSVTCYPDEVDLESGRQNRATTRAQKTSINVAKRAWWSRADSESDEVKTYARGRRRSPAKISVTVTDDVMSSRGRRHSRTTTRSISRDARSAGRGDIEHNKSEGKYIQNNGAQTSCGSRRDTSRNRRSWSMDRTTDGDCEVDMKRKDSCEDDYDTHGRYINQDRDACGVSIASDGRRHSRDRKYGYTIKHRSNETKTCRPNVESFNDGVISDDRECHSSRNRRRGSLVRSRSTDGDTAEEEIISNSDRKRKTNWSAHHRYQSDEDLGNSVRMISESGRSTVNMARPRTAVNRTYLTDAEAVDDDIVSKINKRHSSRGRRSRSRGRYANFESEASDDIELESANRGRTSSNLVCTRCCRQAGGGARSASIRELRGNTAVQTVSVERTANLSRRNSSRSRRPWSAGRSNVHENKTCNANVEALSIDRRVFFSKLHHGSNRRPHSDSGEPVSCSFGYDPVRGYKGTSTDNRRSYNIDEILLKAKVVDIVGGLIRNTTRTNRRPSNEDIYSNRRLCGERKEVMSDSDTGSDARNTTGINSQPSKKEKHYNAIRSVTTDRHLYDHFNEMSDGSDLDTVNKHKRNTTGINSQPTNKEKHYDAIRSVTTDRSLHGHLNEMSDGSDFDNVNGHKRNTTGNSSQSSNEDTHFNSIRSVATDRRLCGLLNEAVSDGSHLDTVSGFKDHIDGNNTSSKENRHSCDGDYPNVTHSFRDGVVWSVEKYRHLHGHLNKAMSDGSDVDTVDGFKDDTEGTSKHSDGNRLSCNGNNPNVNDRRSFSCVQMVSGVADLDDVIGHAVNKHGSDSALQICSDGSSEGEQVKLSVSVDVEAADQRESHRVSHSDGSCHTKSQTQDSGTFTDGIKCVDSDRGSGVGSVRMGVKTVTDGTVCGQSDGLNNGAGSSKCVKSDDCRETASVGTITDPVYGKLTSDCSLCHFSKTKESGSKVQPGGVDHRKETASVDTITDSVSSKLTSDCSLCYFSKVQSDGVGDTTTGDSDVQTCRDGVSGRRHYQDKCLSK